MKNTHEELQRIIQTWSGADNHPNVNAILDELKKLTETGTRSRRDAVPGLSDERIAVLADKAGGQLIGAPSSREEERAMAVEIQAHRRAQRAGDPLHVGETVTVTSSDALREHRGRIGVIREVRGAEARVEIDGFLVDPWIYLQHLTRVPCSSEARFQKDDLVELTDGTQVVLVEEQPDAWRVRFPQETDTWMLDKSHGPWRRLHRPRPNEARPPFPPGWVDPGCRDCGFRDPCEQCPGRFSTDAERGVARTEPARLTPEDWKDIANGRDEDVELDSPNFVPKQLEELKARNYQRVNDPRRESASPPRVRILYGIHKGLEGEVVAEHERAGTLTIRLTIEVEYPKDWTAPQTGGLPKERNGR